MKRPAGSVGDGNFRSSVAARLTAIMGRKSETRFAKLVVPLSLAGMIVQSTAAQKPEAEWGRRGQAVGNELSAGQFEKVEKQFDEAVTKAMPVEKLAATWEALINQVGALKEIVSTRVQEMQGYEVARVTCQFVKKKLIVQVAFGNGRIAGLSFVSAEEEWSQPSCANSSAFHEEAVTLVDGAWELPGARTPPSGVGPFPAAVLVQGSGPEDEDETIGPNKPFKDLAWGLASRGVAMFRCTKRTLKYGPKSSSDPAAFTSKEETIDDARATVALLAQWRQIDPKRICVLGYSLGGYLAPRIATSDAQIAGIILLASNARPVEQLLIEQTCYEAGLSGQESVEAQKQVAAAEEAAHEIESPNPEASITTDLLGSETPASYWLDLRGYNPAAVAAKLQIPILILQGERDYQVPTADFERWRKALTGRPNATLKAYPGLNHLFIAGSGTPTADEYTQPGHVAAQATEDIAGWITAAANKAS